MTEYLNREGYVFERRSLNRDLFYLLCIFSGSKRLAEIVKDDGYNMAWELKLAFESHEIQRLLVGIAVHLRIMYEQTKPVGEDDPFYDVDPELCDYDWREDLKPIGLWWRDTGQVAEPKPLLFRQACNKIIHATKIEIQKDCLGTDSWRWYFCPEVALHGIYQGKPWKITMHIEEFVDQAYSFTMIDPYEGI